MIEIRNLLYHYTVHLADNALILGQRNAEWTGHGPVLEQDIAISNIALDLVGQARMLYQYAAELINPIRTGHPGGQSTDLPGNGSTNQLINQPTGQPITEDSLAYLRNADQFSNCLLVELEKGDWAVTVLRQFFFSSYQFYFYERLQNSSDKTLAAIAAKALKEVTYHLRWSAEWVIRLGDGTGESHQRMTKALQQLWPYTAELVTNATYETVLAAQGIAVDLEVIEPIYYDKLQQVLSIATLSVPENTRQQGGGKQGKHTAAMAAILAEMQYLQRTYPGAIW